MRARPPETRPGPLCAEVLELLDRFRAAVVRAPVAGGGADSGADGVLDQLDALADRVRRPLRLGVCGEVSAGKSTLVNALLGSVMAPTGAAETTQLVTWYAAGEMERADVHLTDGTRRQVWLTEDGRVPPDVGVPLEQVVDLYVQVPTAPLLRTLTLVDTPGLSSVRDVNSARSRAALYGTGEPADGGAPRGPEFDALLFLLQGQQEEVDALAGFCALTGVRSRAANVIAVLSKVDQRSDEEPPLVTGARRADRLRAEPALRDLVTDVVPVIGLLAETVTAQRLRRADLAALARLAAEPDLEDLLVSADDLRELGAGALAPERERLLGLLGLHGLRVAAEAVAGGADLDRLNAALLEASGFDRLRRQVLRWFAPRGDALKADQALGALERLTYQLPEPASGSLRALLEELLLRPVAHVLRELWAVRAADEQRRLGTPLPAGLDADLTAVVTGGTDAERLGLPEAADTAELLAGAYAGARRAQAWAARPLLPAAHRAIADVVRTSYAQLATRLEHRPLPPPPRSAGAPLSGAVDR